MAKVSGEIGADLAFSMRANNIDGHPEVLEGGRPLLPLHRHFLGPWYVRLRVIRTRHQSYLQS